MKINIHKAINTVMTPFRKKRMTLFMSVIKPTLNERILDVGGTIFNWNLIHCQQNITLLNLKTLNISNAPLPKNFSHIIGDATNLSFDNNEYEICFSNSVIEHVGSLDHQKKFANEVCRVGERIWVQTPAKSFFFEPHYLTPFIHWLPRKVQKKILRNFSVWGLITRPSQEEVNSMVDEIRLLSYNEIKELFPDCTIKKERFFFMTKSFIIIKQPTE